MEIAVLVIVAIIFVMLVSMKKPAEPAKPVEPVPVVPVENQAPPQFLGVRGLIDGAYVQEDDSLAFSVSYEESSCGGGGPKLFGCLDNGTGPYEARIEATVRATGSVQPVFREDDQTYCNGLWIPCSGSRGHGIEGAIRWYPGATRPWSSINDGTLCNPLIRPVLNGPLPVLPAGTAPTPIDFRVWIRNRFGAVTDPWPSTQWLKRSACNSSGGATEPVNTTTTGGCNG